MEGAKNEGADATGLGEQGTGISLARAIRSPLIAGASIGLPVGLGFILPRFLGSGSETLSGIIGLVVAILWILVIPMVGFVLTLVSFLLCIESLIRFWKRPGMEPCFLGLIWLSLCLACLSLFVWMWIWYDKNVPDFSGWSQ